MLEGGSGVCACVCVAETLTGLSEARTPTRNAYTDPRKKSAARSPTLLRHNPTKSNSIASVLLSSTHANHEQHRHSTSSGGRWARCSSPRTSNRPAARARPAHDHEKARRGAVQRDGHHRSCEVFCGGVSREERAKGNRSERLFEIFRNRINRPSSSNRSMPT